MLINMCAHFHDNLFVVYLSENCKEANNYDLSSNKKINFSLCAFTKLFPSAFTKRVHITRLPATYLFLPPNSTPVA